MELVITEYINNIICAWFSEKRLVRVHSYNPGSLYNVGDIYIGKVKNIVKNINAAFVDIGADELCFLQLKENDDVKMENEIAVQIVREGIRTKQPVVSRGISVAGRYLIITDKKGINVSKKIKNIIRRKELKELLINSESDNKEKEIGKFGFIVRTNAENIDDKDIIREKEYLIQVYADIIRKEKLLPVYSALYKAESGYIEAVRDSYASDITRIITDIPDIYYDIKDYMKISCPDMTDILSLYTDNDYPLDSLFGISVKIKKALQKKVWLDSGAYIVIDVTEACVVIDVNSGKLIKGKKAEAEQNFFKINCEAAEEIMLQLKLRNLSGIIIIDFIDMKSPEYNRRLLAVLSELASKDIVSCNVVDITKLGLVEMTRKKQNRPLYEQFKITDDKLVII